jgi:hypothetical protein
METCVCGAEIEADCTCVFGRDGKLLPPSAPLLDAATVERFFCLAVLAEGTEVTERVLKRFLDYRNRKDEVLAQRGVVNEKAKT